jgi:hypothetical protein
MVVTIFVYTLLIMGVVTLLRTMLATSSQQTLGGNSVDQIQSITSDFTNELRNAATGNDGSYPIYEASTTEIIFFTNFESAGSTTADRIRYYLSGTSLIKGRTAPSGNPPKYLSANESTTTVATKIMNGTSSVFFYYDGNFNGSTTPLTQPVNINQIRYVQISLTPQIQDLRGATTTYSAVTGAAVRNLKTNLGN